MEEYYPRIELKISFDEFLHLPRNAAYKFEYFGGRAVLTARPKLFSCVRDLSPVKSEPLEPVDVRALPRVEMDGLDRVFYSAVVHTQPFASLDEKTARMASDSCLRKTLNCDDGPLIEAACFQAFSRRFQNDKEHAVGGLLVTLVPKEILTVPYAGMWKETPPANAVEEKLGVPHLTWVFVNHWEGRRGIASALLERCVLAIKAMGFTELTSTFLLDNGPSMLWHWKHEFKLLPGWSAFMSEGRKKS